MSKLTKAAVTIQLLHSGRNGNSGPLFSVDEIVAKVNEVFPGGKGTSKDCVYFYASREKIGLSRSNKQVDRAAYDRLQALLTLKESETPGEGMVSDVVPELAPEPTIEERREQIRSEVEAADAELVDLNARLKAAKEARKAAQQREAQQVRILKGGAK